MQYTMSQSIAAWMSKFVLSNISFDMKYGLFFIKMNKNEKYDDMSSPVNKYLNIIINIKQLIKQR